MERSYIDQTAALTGVLHEMELSKTDILGVSETRWSGSGHFTAQSGHMIIYSGGKDHQKGVGVIIAKHLASCNITYKAVSERVLVVEVPAKPVDLTIIQVYAPTSASTEEEIDDFYELLQTTFDEIPRRNMLIIGGDFNAKVGECFHDTNTTGRFGLGEGNERGEKLVEFCIDN